MTVGLDEAQKTVNELGGTGSPIFDGNGDWTRKERVTYSDYDGKYFHVIDVNGQAFFSKVNDYIYPEDNEHGEVDPTR